MRVTAIWKSNLTSAFSTSPVIGAAEIGSGLAASGIWPSPQNRWGGRPQRHRCATLWVVETCNRGAAHDEHYHDWPGYLQVGLPDPRRQRERKGGAQAQGAPERPDRLLREAGTLHSSDGGLWRRTSLGAHSDGPWSHGEADRPRSGETLCQEGQEERCRRRCGDLRGGFAARRQVRAGQDRRAAGDPGVAYGAIAAGQATEDAGERHPRAGH